MKKLYITLIGLLLIVSISCKEKSSVAPPDPYGVLPTDRQLKWQELEMIGLIHFGLNTFTDQEWGYGDVAPEKFNPSDFDADQIVSAAKSAGLKGLILVAKHHDGFCLWPTETTDYNISHSPWKDGEGDMVKEFEEATRKQGLEFGVYCSPWDRNNEHYGTDEYLEIYREQLKELYTDYGDLFEAWFDGANGGDGYYGGADEERKIDKDVYYDWDSTWTIVRELQPQAVIFSDAGWDVRWVGNEDGYSADTTWQTFTPKGIDGSEPAPGNVEYEDSPIGTRDGEYWMPAENDAPLRPGWFYHADEENKEKKPNKLFDMYVHSVGRSANLNLGLAPDTTGQMSQQDVKTLKEFGDIIDDVFAENLLKNAALKASNVRGDAKEDYGVENLLDGDRYTYWATDDDVHDPELTIEFDEEQKFDLIQLRENIKLGQRITSVAVDQWQNDDWEEIATATGIGSNRLIELDEPITTSKIRMRVTDAPVGIALSEVGVFNSAKE